MMWLEIRMQAPCAFISRISSRTARLDTTSSPLVGSSNTTFRGPCTSERASATLSARPPRRALGLRPAGEAARAPVGNLLHAQPPPQLVDPPLHRRSGEAVQLAV